MGKLLTLAQFSASMDSFADKCDERFMKRGEGGNYTIKQQAAAEAGYLMTYQLYAISGEEGSETETAVGAKINIPKDFLVKSAEPKTATASDVANALYNGITTGDKYIDFVINTVDADESAHHIYLPVKELVDAYTEGDGIGIDSNNEITIAIDTENANGLAVTSSGLKLNAVVASENGAGGSNGAMTAQQAEKLAGLNNYSNGNGIDITEREISVKVDTVNARGLSVTNDGLALAAATPDTYADGAKTANGTYGAMSSADKYKLDNLVESTDAEVAAVIAAIWAE